MEQLQVIQSGNHCTVVIQELHLNYNENIFQIIDKIIESNLPNTIIIDCKFIQKVNSSGIGRLIYLKKYVVEEKNIEFKLINVNPHILKTLRAVKVNDLLGLT